MLRSQKIPAGVCYQVLRRDLPYQGLVLHGLNGIYLHSVRKWVRVDPRGNTNICNAQFDLEEEQLAFPMDSRAGEFIYDTIFINPAQIVVETLKAYDNRTKMWPHLPRSLDGNI
jgi:hypothetical protein